MKKHKKIIHQHHHISIDYCAYHSKMNKWNATYKTIFAFMALVIVISADIPIISIITLFFMCGLSVGIGKIKICDYIRLLSVPMIFILMSGIAILLQFGTGQDSIFYIPFLNTGIYVTSESINRSASLAIRALGAVSCLYMLALSTHMGEIIATLGKMHIPNIIIELMHLIYRYLFILSEINRKQRDASRSRLGYIDRKTALSTFGKEMANLLILSVKQAGNYYDALESRGHESSCLFWEEKKNIKISHLIWSVLYIVVIGVIIV